MSLMLRAEHDGDRLTHDEVVANCVLLLFAGHETTTNLLGNGLFHLLRHPDELARPARRRVPAARCDRGVAALRRARAGPP
jgi:cytochrome P450